MSTSYKILSIDAWRVEGGWQWNNWRATGIEYDGSLDASPRALLKWFRKNDLLGSGSVGRVAIEDDGYNIVVLAKGTREPIYAIEYCSAH